MMSSLFLYSVILSTGGYPPVAVQVSVVVWVAGRELLSAVNSVNGVSVMRTFFYKSYILYSITIVQ